MSLNSEQLENYLKAILQVQKTILTRLDKPVAVNGNPVLREFAGEDPNLEFLMTEENPPEKRRIKGDLRKRYGTHDSCGFVPFGS